MIRSALLGSLVLAIAAGCMPSGPPPASYYGAMVPKQGPSHPPTTESAWSTLEASAARTAQAGGGQLRTSMRLTSDTVKAPSSCILPTGQVMCVPQPVVVKAGECYDVGVACGWPSMVRVDVRFDRGVNDASGGSSFEGSSGAATGSFCADHAGTANVTVSALTNQRVMLTSERLEYALAVAARAEDTTATAARRKTEAADVAGQRAVQDARVKRAKADCDQCTREENNCRGSGRRSLECYGERRRCDDRKRDDGC